MDWESLADHSFNVGSYEALSESYSLGLESETTSDHEQMGARKQESTLEGVGSADNFGSFP